MATVEQRDEAIRRGDLALAHKIELERIEAGWTGIRVLRLCPYSRCRKPTLRSAVKCRHCNEVLPDVLTGAVAGTRTGVML